MNIQPSEEQLSILIGYAQSNVRVNSVAGSGKTTSILFIAESFPQDSILLITYNSRLRLETRERAERLGIHNLEIHTYHSMGVKYFAPACMRDPGIVSTINNGVAPKTLFAYTTIVLDEFQDVTPLYFRYLGHILRHFLPNRRPKICLFGDVRQCIYQFNGADSRFLRLADRIFSAAAQWTECTLATTYRCSAAICDFINAMSAIGTDGAVANAHPKLLPRNAADGLPKPQHLICKLRGFAQRIMRDVIAPWLTKYGPTDIFILVPSVKFGPKSPMTKLANCLTSAKVPIFIPGGDDVKPDLDVMKNKVVFLTFHQSKGLERACVMVYNFDASYFTYYARTEDQSRLPNTLYVACSRAKSELLLTSFEGNTPFSFAPGPLIRQYCRGEAPVALSMPVATTKFIPTCVSDLIRYQPSEMIITALGMIKYRIIAPQGEKIAVKHVAQGVYRDTKEQVSNINGIALPTYYQLTTTGRSDLFDWLARGLDAPTFITGLCGVIVGRQTFESLILQMVNIYRRGREGLNCHTAQLKSYDWIDKFTFEAAAARLKQRVSNAARYEVQVQMSVPYAGKEFPIVGYIDCVDGANVYEFKCVERLEAEHIVQLGIYAAMMGRGPNYLLFNVLDGETVEITYTEALPAMVEYLFCSKMIDRAQVADEEFVQAARKLLAN